ncbi:hypothetical protein FISHEDRAFT_71467 [Fistulina hepatica ATCC 64428]|uniref:Uncharacterized protein n=1 Tax=Fistulina hepatica ATCC 64428 TaxID=1128425 RepID=A0A0D7AH04_9AGAR|nr:hypothetical protein FISHEDRAFT_71467 [Fistulina hepatica ATCC 64428]
MFKDMGFQEDEGYLAMRENYSGSYRQATYEDSHTAYAESHQTYPANSPTFPDVCASYQSTHSCGGCTGDRPQCLLPSSRHVYGDRPLYDCMSRQSSYVDGSARGAYAQLQQESMQYHQQSPQQDAQLQVQSLLPIATSHLANTLSKPSLLSPPSAQLPRPSQLQLAPVLPPSMSQSSQGMSYPYRAAPWPA